MKTSNRITRHVDDLAGYWTEPVLEILKVAGNAHATVQSEIETWRTLNAALQIELREQPPNGATTSLNTLKEKVLARAASQLARKYNINEDRIRRSSQDWRSTTAEHRLFQELVREPAARIAFVSARQTDFVPRIQLSTVTG